MLLLVKKNNKLPLRIYYENIVKSVVNVAPFMKNS